MLLSSASLISVGFSSWAIHNGIKSSEQASLKTEADGDIADINKYIVYGKSQVFEFCKDDLIRNEAIVKDGVVTISFSIETGDSLQNHLHRNATSFTFSTYLFDSDNLFLSGESDVLFSTYIGLNNKIQRGASNTKDSINYDTELSFTASENYCKASFTVTKFLDEPNIYFALKYPFTFENDSFKKKVYPKLSNGTLKLSFKAEVE